MRTHLQLPLEGMFWKEGPRALSLMGGEVTGGALASLQAQGSCDSTDAVAPVFCRQDFPQAGSREGASDRTPAPSCLLPAGSATVSLETDRLFHFPCVLFRSIRKGNPGPKSSGIPTQIPHSSACQQLGEREQPLSPRL